VSVHPIEEESYRILADRLDLSSLPAISRAVVARVVHATADVTLAGTMVLDEAALHAAIAALRGGAPVVADVAMVAAGISGRRARSFLDCVPPATAGVAPADAGDAAPTRSARAMRVAAAAHPVGAIFVVGCAPTALVELVALSAAGALHPALVIGMPVGFVGAAASKAALRASGLPSVSNVGERGGSAAAAAACNALIRIADTGASDCQ
jgi:precorrin-8X/cobalt-precorrin-8 methylmutase